MLARSRGKSRIIAETGPASTGSRATPARSRARVRRLHGDRGHAAAATQRRADVSDGGRRCRAGRRRRPDLKEAVSAAIRDWVANVADTHYIIGSAVGPAPLPWHAPRLQRVIGDEARGQILAAVRNGCRSSRRLRRRRLESDRHVRPLLDDAEVEADRRWRQRARARRPSRRSLTAGGQVPATARSPRSSPTRTVRSSGALDLRRPRYRASVPRMRCSATAPAPATWRHRRRCPAALRELAASRESAGARAEPRSPGCSAREAMGRGRARLLTLSGRGDDKDLAEATQRPPPARPAASR